MEVNVLENGCKFYAVRLDKGEDVLNSIQEWTRSHAIQDAVVLSGIGTLDECCMHFVTTVNDASQMDFKHWSGIPLEVASIDGIIADGIPHLHMVVSTNEACWGGHLEVGCRTLYLCELMIMTLPSFGLTRVSKVQDTSKSDYLIKNLTQKNRKSSIEP